MYVVKLNGRKVTLKSLTGFKSYEAVRNALRKYLRARGQGRIHGQLGYSIARV
jgi:hypothetical protein